VAQRFLKDATGVRFRFALRLARRGVAPPPRCFEIVAAHRCTATASVKRNGVTRRG
jgi:hypothetical protein